MVLNRPEKKRWVWGCAAGGGRVREVAVGRVWDAWRLQWSPMLAVLVINLLLEGAPVS